MTDKPKSITTSDTPVLIVDDTPQYSQVLVKILSKAFGYRDITVIDTLQEAYTALASKDCRFRLIFVDYRFPSGDTGGELLLRLKAERLLEGRVAFLITSEPSPENLKQVVAAGAFGLIAKPFDREQLKKQLTRADMHLGGVLEEF